MSNAFNIVVAGTGQAGAQIVASLRSSGFEGSICLIGEEANLPYQRPPLSKGYLGGSIDASSLQLRPASFYETNRVETILGDPIVKIDRDRHSVQMASGKRVEYGRLAIATGSRPRPWSVPGSTEANVLMLRSIADADKLRAAISAAERIAVVGGGFIGLEVAACAAGMGKAVTVIEAGSRLMARAVAPVTSDFYLSHHGQLGVSVRLSSTVSRVDAMNGVYRLTLANATLVDADLILAGIGGLPNDELAKEAGLTCINGVVVDQFARTSDPDIVAAGDCTSQPSAFALSNIRLESVQNAIEQSKTAAASLMGATRSNDAVPWFWSDQGGVKLQTAGLSGTVDSYVLRGDPGRKKFTVFHLSDGVVVAADSVNAPADHMVARQLILSRRTVDIDHLADPSRPLKALTDA